MQRIFLKQSHKKQNPLGSAHRLATSRPGWLLSLLLNFSLLWAPVGWAEEKGMATSQAGTAIKIEMSPVPLLKKKPQLKQLGALRFLSGFKLTSKHPNFGGFSGLLIDSQSREMIAISDRGHWLSAQLELDPSGTLVHLKKTRLGPLLDTDGQPVTGTDRRDAEEIVDLAELGFLVTFEGHHRAVRYTGSLGAKTIPPTGPPLHFDFPPDIAAAPENKGMEAVSRMKDGRFLILSEGYISGGKIVGWVGRPGSEPWQRLSLQKTLDLEPTGAAPLDGGDLLLLERSYSKREGNIVRLSRLDADQILPGATLIPHELARLALPMTVDNMEAVATTRGPNGKTHIYILSDDNFSPEQRTLILQFEWP